MQPINHIFAKLLLVTNHHAACRKGEAVSLGCQVDTVLCGDYHSVKWYKEGTRLGVISHGFRYVTFTK